MQLSQTWTSLQCVTEIVPIFNANTKKQDSNTAANRSKPKANKMAETSSSTTDQQQHSKPNKRSKNRHDKNGKKGANDDNKKLSRALSWALRHGATDLGWPMTSDGYVPVDEVLNSSHPRFKGKVTMEAIQEMVVTNDKQRFKLQERPRHLYYPAAKLDSNNTNEDLNEDANEDANDSETVSNTDKMILCIRANQGHSLTIVDPNLLFERQITLEDLESLSCVVHGTYFKPWNIIQTAGLNKMNRTHIHLAAGMDAISGMRKNCTVFIYIDAAKCIKDGIILFQSDNGVILTAGPNEQGILPVEYFSHVTDSQGKILMDNRK